MRSRIHILLIFVSACSYAQSRDSVLVSNPPLTQSMVDKTRNFVEWTLDIHLSPQQSQKMQQIMVSSWKKNDQSEIKGMLEIIDVYDRLSTVDQDQRKAVKERLREVMLQNLRQDPEDALAKILLAAYKDNKPRIGADGFTGLYRMMRPKAININSTVPETGYYIEHIVFLPGGKLYRALPPEGLLYFDESIAQQSHANDWGSYEIKNGQIHIWLGPDKTPYVITRNGDRLNNPPSLGKGSFRPIPNCDDLKLEGNYRRHESEPTITFTKDGRFRDGGIFAYFGTLAKPDGTVYRDDGPGGSGDYHIEQNTLELRYSDGRVKRIVIQVFPENLVKKPAVPSILLREERLERY